MILTSAALLAAAILWVGWRVTAAFGAVRAERARDRSLRLLAAFAPAVAAADDNPRALLVWQPLARAARQIDPASFAALDRASGASFPFGAEHIQAAHARWTAEWLAWEAHHDAEYKRLAAEAEEEVDRSGGSPAARARLAGVEREKLERYQQRYEEYVRVAKALQALLD